MQTHQWLYFYSINLHFNIKIFQTAHYFFFGNPFPCRAIHHNLTINFFSLPYSAFSVFLSIYGYYPFVHPFTTGF